MSLDVRACRDLFPSFKEQSAGDTIFFDAVGGTQVPYSVIDATVNWYRTKNGNKGGIFRRSVETDALMQETREVVAEFINAPSSEEIIFGPNFTTLTLNMSRAIAKTWNPGDNIILSDLDHEANVAPWILAAKDAGVEVRFIPLNPVTWQLDYDTYAELIDSKTRLVAFCAASSAIGTRPDVKRIVEKAREVGAITYVDAVAYAPHLKIDVQEWGADFVGFSAYKFFGPHVGVLWGRRELLENLDAYRIRPPASSLPLKWMNGAQSYETIGGVKACIEYLNTIGMDEIQKYEEELTWYFINQIKDDLRFTVWGITDQKNKQWRVPTVAISVNGAEAHGVAKYLAENNIDVWSRSIYSMAVSDLLSQLNDKGFLRIGFCHYNTFEEINTLITTLKNYGN